MASPSQKRNPSNSSPPTPPTPSTAPSSSHTPKSKSNLPLTLLRHGSALISFGLLFGFIVPATPYPRLALTAHIQFAVEGTMVLAAGLILSSTPFTSTAAVTTQLADHLRPWQTRVVHWGCAGIWVTLLSEAANAWWGTRWVLGIAHEAAGLKGDGPAEVWMEKVVAAAHYPFAVLLATVWPVILIALFSSD